MPFLLPLASTILLGYTFDLRNYNFMSGIVYSYDSIKPFTQISEINKLIAEYKLIESQAEYREFLGVDVATNLKTLVNGYNYRFRSELKMDIELVTLDVYMALKISLRTVNETVPFDTPQISDWQSELGWRIGTHYVKSIIYGADMFLLLSIWTNNEQHKAAIQKSILSTLGKSGTLDASFKEKFRAVLEESNANFLESSFGTVPYSADNIPPRNIDDMLELKDNLVDIMKTVNDGKGAALFYEMQPISLLSSEVPLIEINSEVFEKLDDVEKKFEDLRIAYEEFNGWMAFHGELSYDDKNKIAKFYQELRKAKEDMINAISNMDISTLGNVNQFSVAMESYGNTNDTQKYRKKFEVLRQQIE